MIPNVPYDGAADGSEAPAVRQQPAAPAGPEPSPSHTALAAAAPSPSDRSRNGNPSIIYWTIGLALVCYVLAVLGTGPVGILLFSLSIAPVVIILSIILYVWRGKITVALALEQFWQGATLSVVVATVLEFISQIETRKIWSCLPSRTWLCGIAFVLVVITGVGYVEETAKLLPISRIRMTAQNFPTTGLWWWRLVTEPKPYALMGLFAASGFATLENVEYVFGEANNLRIMTSIYRALVAIPFHLSCTTFAAAMIAKSAFTVAPPRAEEGGGDAASVVVVDDESSAAAAAGVTSPGRAAGLNAIRPLLASPSHRRGREEEDDDDYEETRGTPAADEDQYVVKNPSLGVVCLGISISAIFHGLYDAGLFLAVQFSPDDDGNGKHHSAADETAWRTRLFSGGGGFSVRRLMQTGITSIVRFATQLRGGGDAGDDFSVAGVGVGSSTEAGGGRRPTGGPAAADELSSSAEWFVLLSLVCYVAIVILACWRYSSLPGTARRTTPTRGSGANRRR